MSEKIIRNPSPEEIEAMRMRATSGIDNPESKSGGKGKLKEVKKDEENKWETINGARIKKKKSRFQPNPIPFKLISSGKTLGPEDSLGLDKEIYVRKLGTDEEGLMTKIRDIESFNGVMKDVFKNCIQSDIDINNLALIDKIHLFSFILAISFGGDLNVKEDTSLICPACRNDVDNKIKVTASFFDDLKIKYIPDSFNSHFILNLSSFDDFKIKLTLKYPTLLEEDLFFSNTITTLEAIKSLIIDFEGEDKDGNPLKEEDLDEVIRWLNEKDQKSFSENIEKFTEYADSFIFKNINCSNNKNCGLESKRKKKDFELKVDLKNVISSLVDKILEKIK